MAGGTCILSICGKDLAEASSAKDPRMMEGGVEAEACMENAHVILSHPSPAEYTVNRRGFGVWRYICQRFIAHIIYRAGESVTDSKV